MKSAAEFIAGIFTPSLFCSCSQSAVIPLQARIHLSIMQTCSRRMTY